MPRHGWGVFLGLLLALLLAADPVCAQSTGGSFGGGNFGGGSTGGGGGSTGGGGGSWGGGSSGGGSWGGGSNTPYNSGETGDVYVGDRQPSSSSGGGLGIAGIAGVVCVSVVVLLVVVVMVVRGARMKIPTGQHPMGDGGGAAGSSGPSVGSYSGRDAMHVQRLSLGIDWRSRGQVQETLERLAQTGDTNSPQGLANLLRETVLALRRAEMAWLYVSQQNLGSFAPQQAEQRFQQLATQMRASFQHEVVRAGGGAVHSQDAPEMRAHSNEGQGTVVVHLIVVARRPLSMSGAPDANQIRQALDSRSALTGDQLVALEVVWSPAADNDRMSTAELEQNYPDMKLIDPASIAGRIFCTYCQGPFAMELLKCPHCGAPAEKSQGNTAPPRA